MKGIIVEQKAVRGLVLAVAVAACAAWTPMLSAEELVYRPINPSFGGNPLYGGYLLNNAQVQNDHEPDSFSRQSAIERFTSQLQSRLLGQILTAAQDGQAGTLSTEEFTVNIVNEDGFLYILVTDNLTGEATTIEVSAF